jgi:hypothetical protein
MKILRLLVLFLSFTAYFIKCKGQQIEINKPIIFISHEDTNRQVTGINYVTDADDLMNAKTIVLGTSVYAEAIISGDTLIANFTPPLIEYLPGLKINVQFPDTNYVHVTKLKCNNLTAVDINLYGHLLPLKHSFKAKETIILIYDGLKFQVLKRKEKSCPENFTQVNHSYCISKDTLGLGLYYNAIIACNNINARICTWAEWYYACQKTGLNLQNMTNGWQWVDSGAVHSDATKIAGNGGCTANSAGTLTTFYRFRCCYDK